MTTTKTTTTWKLDPEAEGLSDCATAVFDGADPRALVGGLGADEALLNALGRAWVLEVACGVDDTDANWQDHGLQWCRAYSAAYEAEALRQADD